jgi:hypothetical protein
MGMNTLATEPRFIRWFSQPGSADVAPVGGRNASIVELDTSEATRGWRRSGFRVHAHRRADAGSRNPSDV